MTKPIYKNALISVSNKEGLIETAQFLFESGTRIVSTGGTAQALKKAGVEVHSVSSQTHFPEVMEGRVKTLHPLIFLPLLARLNHKKDEQELKARNLQHFDLLICNLYPFESVIHSLKEKELLEWIDVGGPSMLRAGAKNFEKITVLCDPKDYPLIQNGQPLSLEKKKELAGKVFFHLSTYDSTIAHYLGKPLDDFSLGGRFFKKLRYGENPQQTAVWYRLSSSGLHKAQLLQGKELSFNNILDIQSAVSVMRDLGDRPCFVGVKHNNPAGAAWADHLKQAIEKGLQADPLSIFGGVVALNKEVDEDMAQILNSIFLECIIAPSYSKKALSLFEKKKKLRLLAWKDMLSPGKQGFSVHTIDGGFLVQSEDFVQIQNYKTNTSIQQDLEMAWKVCAHLKSNAIALVSQGQTVGLGMGQVDRVTAVELACRRMEKHHPKLKEPVVMASDGFFPFPDSVELAAEKGIQWIIQPGGSVKDPQVLKKASELGVNMICTGKRHFKH